MTEIATREHAGANATRAGAQPELSVIVTVVERPEPLDALYREYAAVLSSCGGSNV
jgi:hypothetical protein